MGQTIPTGNFIRCKFPAEDQVVIEYLMEDLT